VPEGYTTNLADNSYVNLEEYNAFPDGKYKRGYNDPTGPPGIWACTNMVEGNT